MSKAKKRYKKALEKIASEWDESYPFDIAKLARDALDPSKLKPINEREPPHIIGFNNLLSRRMKAHLLTGE
ncbi:MAG: hypothetical protein GY776_12335 [Alteromonas sp.]|nr:hypothetical protein [Alteromonas sp.]